MKEILVIGDTGAQGLRIVKTLSSSKCFAVKVLTRDVNSSHTQQIAKFPNVTLVKNTQGSQINLHTAFQSHYVYASTYFELKNANQNERYHWGHNGAIGRAAEYIIAQRQAGLNISIITTRHYMKMLIDAMFLPKRQPDKPFVWANPASISLLWLFDNLSESARLDLRVATEEINFVGMTAVFTKMTGKKGAHKYLPLEEYLPLAEPYPNALTCFIYGGRGCRVRDMQLLDRILPNRIKFPEDWMRKAEYTRQRKNILKGVEDLKKKVQLIGQSAGSS
ncbi:hypothetical protein B0O99DRAFT_652819 [Bisporella sp. PMI_857]|nr:hypothetical protein B0O99DRAFT_652819 [Bisporella sp. PMI_857]